MILPYNKPLNLPLDWVSGKSYVAGNVVAYSSSLWRCTTSNSDAVFNQLNWTSIAVQGAKIYEEYFIINAPQSTVTLQRSPIDGTAIVFYKSGIQRPNSDYTVTTNVVDFSPYVLQIGDSIVVVYQA